jgi:hypothetical protein
MYSELSCDRFKTNYSCVILTVGCVSTRISVRCPLREIWALQRYALESVTNHGRGLTPWFVTKKIQKLKIALWYGAIARSLAAVNIIHSIDSSTLIEYPAVGFQVNSRQPGRWFYRCSAHLSNVFAHTLKEVMSFDCI